MFSILCFLKHETKRLQMLALKSFKNNITIIYPTNQVQQDIFKHFNLGPETMGRYYNNGTTRVS